MSNIVKNPAKHRAIELYATQPSITAEDVAIQCNVPKETIYEWRRNINFIEAIYDRYMVQFGSELPEVLGAMVREAKAGNVQAGRLVLEHSGKLVKNVNITIDSPFEKFLKSEDVEDGEFVEVLDKVVIPEDLPPRRKPKTAKEEEVILNREVKKELNKKKRNEKRKLWYAWKKRAEAVGIPPLPANKPTKGQRKEWEQSIIDAEANAS